MNGNRSRILATFVVGAMIGAFSAVEVAPHIQRTSELASMAGTNGDLGGVGPSAGSSLGPGETGANGLGSKDNPAYVPPGLECKAGRNGGATDAGVTANSINLATTVVRSGTGSAFLGEVQFAMEAVKNKINRAGGICGRQLNINYIDDGWEAVRGAGFLRNILKSRSFAIPVAPSSEGLRVVIDAGDIDLAGVPVVGTDGMLIDQYLKVVNGKVTSAAQPMVWSVAAATASSARIMVRDAAKRGAKHFAIIFDRNYRFGAEAAAAFDAEVKRLTGSHVDGYNSDNSCVRLYCGVEAAQQSYSTEVSQFNSGHPKAVGTYIAMFLEPTTALTWMATPGAPQPKDVFGIGAAQPLFTRSFATNCQSACDQMQVWTSYKPPIEGYANDPIVRQYEEDLHRTKPDADVDNAFSQGGYIGMQLLVKALQDVGPFLTRARLRQVLNTMQFRSGLTIQDTLRWTPTDHFANATMQAFTIQFKSTFSGWRTGQIASDPTPERGIS